MKLYPKWKTALVASLLVGVVVAGISHALTSGGHMFLAPGDYTHIQRMPYEEALKYIDERTQQISKWDSLQNGVHFYAFWMSLVFDTLLYGCVAFAGCMTFLRMQREH